MASLSVAGKYAIITGAGSGINLSFASLLLSKGAAGVLLADLSLRPEAQSLISANPTRAYFHRTDVRSWPDLSSLMAAGLRHFPRIDIVVPGAGIFEPHWSTVWEGGPDVGGRSSDKQDADPGTYACIDVNLTHPIRLSQLAMSYWMREKMRGQLVFVSSVAGHTPSWPTPMYIASKHGVTGYVRSLGLVMNREFGIRVAAVAPGGVKVCPFYLWWRIHAD